MTAPKWMAKKWVKQECKCETGPLKVKFVSHNFNGLFLIINDKDECYELKPKGWSKICDDLIMVSVGKDNSAYGLNKELQLVQVFSKGGKKTIKIKSPQLKWKSISCLSCHHLVGCNQQDKIFVGSNKFWNEIGGLLTNITIGKGDGVIWGCNKNDEIYRRDGEAWTKVNGKGIFINAWNRENALHIPRDDTLWVRLGNNEQKIGGLLICISIDPYTCWGCNRGGDLYKLE
jgi:hypothetical protein